MLIDLHSPCTKKYYQNRYNGKNHIMQNQKSALVIFMFALVQCICAQQVAYFDFVEYQGRDKVFETKSNSVREFRNPVLAGFYPDPGICRKGDTFYLVNSSFAYYPGIPIFTSKDMVHWIQLGHVLDRPSQLNLDRVRISGGIYAPSINYNPFNETFYLITTFVDGTGNFLVKTKDPAKGWSDPILLPAVKGIDPSLFFEDDGKAYIVHNNEPAVEPRWDGHRAIWIHQFDMSSDKTFGNPKIILDGGIDPSKNPVWIEGPHLYKRNGKYLLIAAEGGTGTNHSEVALLADNVFGPYKPCPINPILTQRDLPENRSDKITSTGHADLIDDLQGNTWAVFLGCRPYEGDLYNTGRETFLLPVKWIGDTPVILPEGEKVPVVVRIKGLEKLPVLTTGNFIWRDDFDSNTLDNQWMMIRTPRSEWYDLKNGQLILNALQKNIHETVQPAFLGRRQQHTTFEFTARFSFKPCSSQDLAGLVCFQNEQYNFVFGKTISDGHVVLVLEKSSGKTERIASTTIPEKYKDVPVLLKISGDGGKYTFMASFDGGNWQTVAKNVDATNLSTKVAGGFVGTFIGPYATSAANSKILKDVYSDYFPVGVAVSSNHLQGREKSLIIKHFNSLTAENAMKPESLMQKDGSYNWGLADKIMRFARENNMFLRGHTLVWHNQTPSWFFKDEKGNFVDSTTMYNRMKKYMTDVMTHFKGSVYCWDVVNEAISDNKGEIWRTNSAWYETCGTGYVEKAFRLAHKIDPSARLYYNDYNMINPAKREKTYNMLKTLLAKGVPIYGIGMQGHWSLQDLNPEEIQKSIDMFSSLGLDIQITELDLTIYGTYHGEGADIQSTTSHPFTDSTEEQQAEMYRQIFSIFRANKGKISSVTFWGLADNHTWLDNFPVPNRKDYPLLFNQSLEPKKAFHYITDF